MRDEVDAAKIQPKSHTYPLPIEIDGPSAAASESNHAGSAPSSESGAAAGVVESDADAEGEREGPAELRLDLPLRTVSSVDSVQSHMMLNNNLFPKIEVAGGSSSSSGVLHMHGHEHEQEHNPLEYRPTQLTSLFDQEFAESYRHDQALPMAPGAPTVMREMDDVLDLDLEHNGAEEEKENKVETDKIFSAAELKKSAAVEHGVQCVVQELLMKVEFEDYFFHKDPDSPKPGVAAAPAVEVDEEMNGIESDNTNISLTLSPKRGRALIKMGMRVDFSPIEQGGDGVEGSHVASEQEPNEVELLDVTQIDFAEDDNGGNVSDHKVLLMSSSAVP